ncbi:retrovirus-related pol polyprotein from transposon TNT 1-94, partial [Tanacetum coccineum]
RVRRPRRGINKWLNWLPVSTHRRLDQLKRQLFNPSSIVSGSAVYSYHSNIPEADAELIATNAIVNFEKDGPLLVVSSGRDTITVASSIKRLAPDHVFTIQVFDGTGHFGMWQSKVLDALFQQGLDIAVEESKPEDVEEMNWLTINRLDCDMIRSCLSREQRNAFSKETPAYKLWVALEEKFLKKNLSDLMNMDEVFKDHDLALILLGSLPEEYELFETTLLNGKDDVSLSEVCAALYSKELRRKDKQISSSGDAQVLLVRGRSHKKGTDKRWRSKSKQRLSKDECAFCHEKAEANVTKCDDEESDLSLVTSSSRNASEIWLLDSACSHHITPHREWFSNFEEHEEVVYTADETPLITHGIGSVRLQNEDGIIVTLKGVRYSPKLKKNPISVGTLASKGFKVRAKDGVMKIISGILVVMKGISKINNTYHYKGRTVVGTVAAVTDGDRHSEAVKLWHMRLGHAGEKSLNLLIKQGLLKGLSSCKLDLCEHCINGNTTRVKFGTAIHKTQGILDYVHSDVWGPSKTISLGRRHYYVTFVDDFSRRVWVYMWSLKNRCKLRLFRSLSRINNIEHRIMHSGNSIMNNVIIKQECSSSGKDDGNSDVQKDQTSSNIGEEYKNDLFTKFCEDEGIVRHFAVRHTPQQNGVDERMNRTLLEKVWCMLSNDGLGKEFWAKVVRYTCHLINRLPSTAIDGKTPFEKWYGKPASDYDSLHVFGSAAYYHVKESKLDPRAKNALFMGITSRIKGYRLWCLKTKKTIFSRDVTFNKSTMLKKVNVELLDGTPKKVEFERLIVPADREIDDNSPMIEGDFEEDEVQTEEPRQQHKSIMDAKIAFLHGDLEEEIYMVQPEGFKVAGKEHEVYDMLIASQSLDEIETLKTQLKSKFEIKDLGEAKMILGMEIVRQTDKTS